MASIDLGQVRDKITGLNKSGTSAPGTTDTYTMTTELNPFGLAQTISVYNGKDGDYVSEYLGDFADDGYQAMYDAAATYFQNGGAGRPYGQTCYAEVSDVHEVFWFISGNASRLICIEDSVVLIAIKTNGTWSISTAAATSRGTNYTIQYPGLYAVSYDNATASQTFMLSIYDLTKITWSEVNTHDMAIYNAGTGLVKILVGGAGGTEATPTRIYCITRYLD